MFTVGSLDELAALVEQAGEEEALYVRWSLGPDRDLTGPDAQCSLDALTGVMLPGLSANSLRVEPWWNGRPVRVWVARRLYDYRHLRDQRGPGVRPWVLAGHECGRGPDNEPLVVCRRPVAWVSDGALEECEATVARLAADEWGPLRRT